jgi:hypothetical protein
MNTIKASLSRLKTTPARRRVMPSPSVAMKKIASTSGEEYCLALLLKYPELKTLPTDLSAEYFRDSQNREIYRLWRDLADVPALRERLDPAVHEHLDVILNRDQPGAANNIENKFADCVMELEKRYYRNFEAKRAEILALDVESGGAGADIARLQEEGMEPSARLRELDVRKMKKRSSSYTGKVRR